jgi:hypothetical protein
MGKDVDRLSREGVHVVFIFQVLHTKALVLMLKVYEF